MYSLVRIQTGKGLLLKEPVSLPLSYHNFQRQGSDQSIYNMLQADVRQDYNHQTRTSATAFPPCLTTISCKNNCSSFLLCLIYRQSTTIHKYNYNRLSCCSNSFQQFFLKAGRFRFVRSPPRNPSIFIGISSPSSRWEIQEQELQHQPALQLLTACSVMLRRGRAHKKFHISITGIILVKYLNLVFFPGFKIYRIPPY